MDMVQVSIVTGTLFGIGCCVVLIRMLLQEEKDRRQAWENERKLARKRAGLQ